MDARRVKKNRIAQVHLGTNSGKRPEDLDSHLRYPPEAGLEQTGVADIVCACRLNE